MKIIKNLLPILIVLCVSYFAVKPFFLSGFFPMHDDTQVARVYEMTKSLEDGMFPVRWVADLGYGYGYPIFNFYAPLAYYVGGIFDLMGFDSLSATKIMMALGVVLAGTFMYLLAKQFWGVYGGIVAAILYVYAPYHAVDIYVRGDTAEFWAYAFIPLVFYGIWKSYAERAWRYVCVGSIGFAAVILSHNLSAMMLTPFVLAAALILYITARKEKKLNNPYFPFAILLVGILIATFYWLPVFAEMKYTNVLSQVGGGADYKDHFVCPLQLWDSHWGFGGSTSTCIDGMSYKVGKLHLVILGLSLFSIFLLRKIDKIKFRIGLFATISLLFTAFLMLEQSRFLWDVIPQMAFFQYPWRFLLMTTFFVSFLGGAVVLLLQRFPVRIIDSSLAMIALIIVLSGAIIIFNADLFTPQMYLKRTVGDYTNIHHLRWTTSKISDEYMPKDFFRPKNYDEIPRTKFEQRDVEIISVNEKTQLIQAEVKVKETTDVFVNHAYFPAWHVFIDQKQEWFKYSNRGLIISIPEGRHTVDIKFVQTPIEKFANILSIAGIFILFLGIIIFQRKETMHAKKAT